ncbi:DUF5707 domain-containing protein [Streptomyces liangshanensis]|uniref:Uncharacterized protein n=1 Tax=Streptomyces liangshanensis TaxID=2717324 RepID=A0A6G9H5X1_9ACTN|nr:DUF5707 domain-containing protein [Streptomyces liangshanensis]QIQ05890.1 hypothetical protein HA039_29510 [Streptomyces liangshanensis]
MPRRTVLSLAAAVVVLGGGGAVALAYAGESAPSLAHSTARYAAPDGARDGSLTFTTEVSPSSGLKGVKVLAWPAKSSFAEKGLTTKDMASAESATCTSLDEDTVRCTYTTAVTSADAETSPRGAWHVAVLVTAKDGATTLDTKAAGFTIG